MPLFTDMKGFKPLKENPFKQEKEMQKLVERNINAIYGLQYVTSEFAPQGDLRIDTLAYDPEQSSLVIIEYKKGSSWSVIDQGYAYLALMLNNKADFVLKFNECMGKNFNLKNINWESSRVIFISPSFNPFQRESLGFQDLPFELWEISQYEGRLISLNQLQASKRKAKLSEVNVGSSEAQKVQREVKKYTVDDLFPESWKQGRELFDELLQNLLSLDSRFSVRPTKAYVGLAIGRQIVIYINPYKAKLRLDFSRSRPKDFGDPQNMVFYRKKSKEYFNQHISSFFLKNSDDIQYASFLAKQALKKYV